MQGNRRRPLPVPLRERLRPVAAVVVPMTLGVGLAGCLAGGGWMLSRIDWVALWPIERIVLQGEFGQIDPETLQEGLLQRPRGFFSLDLEALQQEILRSPWVQSVQIRRLWPDTIEVSIQARHPVARWGETHLVDRHGEIFGPVNLDEWRFLPMLDGEPGRQVPLMQRYLQVSARLADVGLEVAGVRESPRLAWRILLEDGGEILMGSGDDVSRLDPLVELMPALRQHASAPFQRVDLRDPRGAAVVWQGSGNHRDAANARARGNPP